MEIKIIKLINSEYILSEICDEKEIVFIEQSLQSDFGISTKLEPLENTTQFLIRPFSLRFVSNDSSVRPHLSPLMYYTDDFIIPIADSHILYTANPTDNLLDLYLDYVKEIYKVDLQIVEKSDLH